MKKLLNLFIIFFSISLFSQNLSEINNSLDLTDSLIHEKEIRIYKGFGITNFTEIFRMYMDKTGKWNIEYFEHFAAVKKKAKQKIKQRELISNNDSDFVWASILNTNIQYLPNMHDIKWKMIKRGGIELKDGEYQIMWEQVAIMDGVGYVIQINQNGKHREIRYNNPEKYIKHYPDIDELIFFSEFLELIRTEFNLWKK
ncbi:hypothetical protein [Aquimarina megaterium]|uniref:hypothetical protein n=1 Tax=Aquimarina megaterium TaxID=1443666 RepID=UPI0004715898|nr:hypothetical protein [Aquimarina megaterium]